MASILIVDDTETERIRIAGLLESAGDHSLFSAADGKQALQCVSDNGIDLVITDLRMPEMGGQDLIERLQEDHAQVPVILMTGYGSEEETVKAIQAGASGYLNKSATARDLQALVAQLLAARATRLAHASVQRRQQLDEYEFRLPSRRVLMSAAAGFLRQRIQAAAICPDKDLLRLGIAVEEALLNACLHGNLELDSVLREQDGDLFESMADQRSGQAPWNQRLVTVTASVSPARAEIVVRDEGGGFDPSTLPDPTDPENLLKPHGRGVMMMKLFLDEVTWNDRGNEVTMVKYACPPAT